MGKTPRVPVAQIRLENGRRAIDRAGGSARLAKLLGHSSASTLSQVFGPNPSRKPSESMMRRMEEVLKLETGVLDKEGKYVLCKPRDLDSRRDRPVMC